MKIKLLCETKSKMCNLRMDKSVLQVIAVFLSSVSKEELENRVNTVVDKNLFWSHVGLDPNTDEALEMSKVLNTFPDIEEMLLRNQPVKEGEESFIQIETVADKDFLLALSMTEKQKLMERRPVSRDDQ